MGMEKRKNSAGSGVSVSGGPVEEERFDLFLDFHFSRVSPFETGT